MQVTPRQVERRAFAPSRNREVVVKRGTRVEQLSEVVVHRRARGESRPPRQRRRATTQATARRGHAGRALPEFRLQRDRLIHIVERRGAAEAVVRGTGRAGLGRDQHDALPGARAVDRRVRRALQDLDVGHIVGVQIRCAVGRSGPPQ